MTEQLDGLYERVVQRVAPRGRLLKSWLLAGGISAEMTALEFEGPAGVVSKVVVRRPGIGTFSQNPNAARDEYRTLLLARALGLSAPAPVDLDLTGQIFAHPYLVMEYIEGQLDFTRVHRADFTLQLAAHLARIHGADCSSQEISFLQRPAQEFEQVIGNHPASPDGLLDPGRIREPLASVWPVPRWNEPGLLHGDYWPGNILWRDGQLAAVIDWEDACFGDPLEDFAISRLDILWIFGREAMESFSRYYQFLRAVDIRALPYWDLYAALRLARLVGTDLSG